MGSFNNSGAAGSSGFHEGGRHGRRSRDVVGLAEVFSDVVSLRFAAWSVTAQSQSTARLEQLLAVVVSAPIPSPQDLQATRDAQERAFLEESSITALSERIEHLITMCKSTGGD